MSRRESTAPTTTMTSAAENLTNQERTKWLLTLVVAHRRRADNQRSYATAISQHLNHTAAGLADHQRRITDPTGQAS